MARRRAARARARRAAAAAGGATTGPKVRRGSWHPKQRSTHFEDALEKYKRWRYDPLKSLASQHFKDDANLNERSYAGAQFYDQFHMPRAVFEEVLRELSAHPPFADKSALVSAVAGHTAPSSSATDAVRSISAVFPSLC